MSLLTMPDGGLTPCAQAIADGRFSTDAWFPPPGQSDTTKLRAAALCVDCPVRRPCLDLVLDFDDRLESGIWGGLSAGARVRIRQASDRERAIADEFATAERRTKRWRQ